MTAKTASARRRRRCSWSTCFGTHRTYLMRTHCHRRSSLVTMRSHEKTGRQDMGIEYAVNGDTKIAYETFGTGGEPLLLVLGIDYQMVWWDDAFCERLVAAGYHVARYDNRDTGLSTHYPEPAHGSPWRALLGGTRPLYT